MERRKGFYFYFYFFCSSMCVFFPTKKTQNPCTKKTKYKPYGRTLYFRSVCPATIYFSRLLWFPEITQSREERAYVAKKSRLPVSDFPRSHTAHSKEHTQRKGNTRKRGYRYISLKIDPNLKIVPVIKNITQNKHRY